MSVTVSPVVQSVTVAPVVQSLTVSSVAVNGSAQSYYNTIDTDRALSSVNTVQNVFSVPDDTFTLTADSVWLFEGSYVIGSGTVPHTTAIGFSEFGNGACTFQTLAAGTSYGTIQRAQDMTAFNSSAGGPVNSSSSSVLTIINFSGRISVVNATNFIPTLTFSAAPTGTNAVKTGSWLRLVGLWTDATKTSDDQWT